MPKTAGARETERKSCRGDKYDDIISLCLHREFFLLYRILSYKAKRSARIALRRLLCNKLFLNFQNFSLTPKKLCVTMINALLWFGGHCAPFFTLPYHKCEKTGNSFLRCVKAHALVNRK